MAAPEYCKSLTDHLIFHFEIPSQTLQLYDHTMCEYLAGNYSKTCLKRKPSMPNNLSALERCPLYHLFWLSMTKISLKCTLFLYIIMLTNKKRLTKKSGFEFRHLMIVYRHQTPHAQNK